MAVFIICEYNPFHLGHEYLIKRAKKRFAGQPVICVMSGNFVQRGECSVADKYLRAQAAVNAGADLVLLLPVPYSFASAEYFASASVYIAGNLAESNSKLFFGSESGSIDELLITGERLSSDEFKMAFTALYVGKTPFAPARQAAYEKLYGDASVLKSSNNILALEYINAINRYGFQLEPCTAKRSGIYVSASTLRSSTDSPLFYASVPSYARSLYNRAGDECVYPANLNNAYGIIASFLRSHPNSDAADGEGGLYSRIATCACTAGDFDELIRLCSTSAYTNARIRRVILNAIFGVTRKQLSSPPTYTLLLAADSIGLEYMKKIKKASAFPILTKPADYKTVPGCEDFKTELAADNFYAFTTRRIRENNYSLKQSPFIQK